MMIPILLRFKFQELAWKKRGPISLGDPFFNKHHDSLYTTSPSEFSSFLRNLTQEKNGESPPRTVINKSAAEIVSGADHCTKLGEVEPFFFIPSSPYFSALIPPHPPGQFGGARTRR